jgi:hypothetical protein
LLNLLAPLGKGRYCPPSWQALQKLEGLIQWNPHQQKNIPFGRNGSIRVDALRQSHQSGRALSEPSKTPRWRITPHPGSIQRVALYIALRSLFHCLFPFCRSPILNDHSGVVANCNNTSEWVYWVRACIGIAMRWVTLRISLLAFLLPARKMQFSLLIIHII